MKPVLELLAGTSVAVGIVVGGVALASAALEPAGQPHRFAGLDVQELWTPGPVVVDRNKQHYERLAPRYASHVVMSAPDTGSENSPALPATSAIRDTDGQPSSRWRMEGAFLALDQREEDREEEMTAPGWNGRAANWRAQPQHINLEKH